MQEAKKYNARHTYIIRKLLPYLWSGNLAIRLRFMLAIFLILLTIGLNILVPITFRKLIMYISDPGSILTLQLSLILLSYGFIWTLSKVIAQFRQIVLYSVFERCIRLFGLKIFEHLNSLSVQYHLSRRTGAITNAIERAQVAIPNIFWGLFFLVVPTFIEIFIATTILCYLYSTFYGAILFVILLVFIIFSIYGTKWSIKVQRLSNEKNQAASAYLVDSLINFETIKYFTTNKVELIRCDEVLKQREEAMTKQLVYMDLIGIGQTLIIGAGLTLLTFLTSRAVIVCNEFNISDLVLINGYLLQFVTPLSTFGFVLRQMRQGLTDMENVMDLLELHPDIIDKPSAKPFKIKSGEIIFDNVCFSYNNDRQILKNISFILPAGKTLAIVGPTGVGKSTISRLLFRLYEPDSGRILIDGQDINEITQESLRSQLGIVPQDTVLFNNTLYYNIVYSFPYIKKEEVKKVVEIACLNKFINQLPLGYETMVGERGLKLSGGEKQRIAIARVLLKKPIIYIFDEATSALDSQTEKKINNSLQKISNTCSRLVITHRLSTVIYADEIVVLDNGEIIERGTHASLLKKNGLYSSLWKKQNK